MTITDSAPAPDPRRCSFFFDVDGTLADIQPRPEQVFIHADILAALARLHEAGVPVAVVSGRPIAQLDQLLAPLRLPAAGVHGAERRHADGRVSCVGFERKVLEAIQQALHEACAAHLGLRLEDKGVAFALHYREAPHLAEPARELAERFARHYADVLTLQPGKCVYELKPRGASKGEAIRTFLDEPPFAGRCPVFIGDDLTDEAGFEVVNRLGGHSIKVGPGETVARQRLASVDAVRRWLAELLHALDGRPAVHFQQESQGSPSP